MNFFVEKNIRVIIFSSSIILIGLLSLLFSAIFIYSKAKSYDEELSKIEEVLTAQQKELLKSSVYLQVQRIDYVREQIENRLKETLKGKVHDAVTIASNLYLKNKD